MISANTVRFAVGAIGNVTQIFLFLSPMPTFFHIRKKGTVGEYSSFPYLVTFFNCMMWVLYALPFVHPRSTWLLTVDSTGCLIEFFYLFLFVVYSNGRNKRLKLILVLASEILVVGLIASLVLSLVRDTDSRVRIIGAIALITATLMYASPLFVMKMVVCTKSVEYMPFCLSLGSFCNAVVWTLYGFEPFDLYVVVPSGLGVLFGLAQLVLYGVYYGPTNKQAGAAELKGEAALNTA